MTFFNFHGSSIKLLYSVIYNSHYYFKLHVWRLKTMKLSYTLSIIVRWLIEKKIQLISIIKHDKNSIPNTTRKRNESHLTNPTT